MNKSLKTKLIIILESNYFAASFDDIYEGWIENLDEIGIESDDAENFTDTKLLTNVLEPVNWYFVSPSQRPSYSSFYSSINGCLDAVRRYITWMADHMLDDNVSGKQYQRMYEAIERLPLEIGGEINDSKKGYMRYMKALDMAIRNRELIPDHFQKEEDDYEYLGDQDILEGLISCTMHAIDSLASAQEVAKSDAEKDLELFIAAQKYCDFRGMSRQRESRELFQNMYSLL